MISDRHGARERWSRNFMVIFQAPAESESSEGLKFQVNDGDTR